MAYNEQLTNKVRDSLVNVQNIEEKKMFRGVVFMINGKMSITVGDNEIMFRIDPELQAKAIEMIGTRPVIMKGKDYKGYIYVHEDAVKAPEDFDYWLNLALDFNKKAKASPEKRKSPKK